MKRPGIRESTCRARRERKCSARRETPRVPRALNNAAIAALIAAAADGKALVDDECAKKAVAELNRDRD